tara:strand:+ start:501 stop:1148 length:648 start_codon:yes stop_codon:yes gene_type:complete
MTAFYNIPTCCTGLTLAGFGGNAELLKESIRTALGRSYIGLDSTNIRDFAMVMATTTDRQQTAKSVLAEIGFSHTEGFTKDKNRAQRHKETGDITLHYIDANSLQDWIDKQTAIKEEERKAGLDKSRQRRFGRPIDDAIRNRPPSCTIRNMKRRQFINYYYSGRDAHNFNTVGRTLIRFCQIFGISSNQYATACEETETFSEFAAEVRRYQRGQG